MNFKNQGDEVDAIVTLSVGGCATLEVGNSFSATGEAGAALFAVGIIPPLYNSTAVRMSMIRTKTINT
jgi:hypothetical protein